MGRLPRSRLPSGRWKAPTAAHVPIIHHECRGSPAPYAAPCVDAAARVAGLVGRRRSPRSRTRLVPDARSLLSHAPGRARRPGRRNGTDSPRRRHLTGDGLWRRSPACRCRRGTTTSIRPTPGWAIRPSTPFVDGWRKPDKRGPEPQTPSATAPLGQPKVVDRSAGMKSYSGKSWRRVFSPGLASGDTGG